MGFKKVFKIFGKLLTNIIFGFGIASLIFIGFSFFVFDINVAERLASHRVSYVFTEFARQNDYQLRDVALNLTSKCGRGPHSECYARELFTGLRNIKYLPTSKYVVLYDPIYVLDHGGDCRNTAALYTSLMHSIGFESTVVCDLDYNHCVSKVPLMTYGQTEYSKYLIADLSYTSLKVYNKSENFWKDY